MDWYKEFLSTHGSNLKPGDSIASVKERLRFQINGAKNRVLDRPRLSTRSKQNLIHKGRLDESVFLAPKNINDPEYVVFAKKHGILGGEAYDEVSDRLYKSEVDSYMKKYRCLILSKLNIWCNTFHGYFQYFPVLLLVHYWVSPPWAFHAAVHISK